MITIFCWQDAIPVSKTMPYELCTMHYELCTMPYSSSSVL